MSHHGNLLTWLPPSNFKAISVRVDQVWPGQFSGCTYKSVDIIKTDFKKKNILKRH